MQTKVCFFFVLTPLSGRINCPAKAVFEMKKFPEFREACGVQAVLLGAAVRLRPGGGLLFLRGWSVFLAGRRAGGGEFSAF